LAPPQLQNPPAGLSGPVGGVLGMARRGIQPILSIRLTKL
jgi:hypothetical protein